MTRIHELAIASDHLEIAHMLSLGWDIEAKDYRRRTALPRNGHEMVVELLLEKNTELESRSSSGRKPLSWAAVNGHEVVVKLLHRKCVEMESKDNYGRTPLL